MQRSGSPGCGALLATPFTGRNLCVKHIVCNIRSSVVLIVSCLWQVCPRDRRCTGSSWVNSAPASSRVSRTTACSRVSPISQKPAQHTSRLCFWVMGVWDGIKWHRNDDSRPRCRSQAAAAAAKCLPARASPCQETLINPRHHLVAHVEPNAPRVSTAYCSVRTRQQGEAAVHPAALVPQQDVVPRGDGHDDGRVDARV